MTGHRVEPLPQRPSLEFQQKRARRLLRDAWAGNADAIARARLFLPSLHDADAMKLDDAQLVVARGHGFDSWLAMKRKIESLTKSPLERFDIAVREGDAATVRDLLDRHAEVRAAINEPRFDFDSPAIHQAKKNLAVVDALLAHGADINQRSNFWAGGFGILEWDLTPKQARPLIERGATLTVWAAAGLGMIAELEAMLRTDPAAAHARGGDGKTALHCAATPQVAALLLEHGADVAARDLDHGSTALQYLIGDEPTARLLVAHGAEVDIFAAARLGDAALVGECLRREPGCAAARVGEPPFAAPGGHIYIWTLGASSPAGVARRYGHEHALELILGHASPEERLFDALWNADRQRADRELASHPPLRKRMLRHPHARALMAEAAWQHRPDTIRLLVDLGFDPHVPTVHRSTALDRASFHGYADIVALLLERDPDPPLAFRNEFGGTPCEACLYGSMHGWKTEHPQDHARTLELLLEAGSPLDPSILPSGNDELDAVMRAWLARRR